MIVWEVEGERLDVKLAGALLAEKGCEVRLVGQPETRPDDSFVTERRRTTLMLVRETFDKGKTPLALSDLDGAAQPDCILVGAEDPVAAGEWIARGAAVGSIVTCVSDFGLDGPYAGRPASELTVTQLSGVGHYIPGQVREPKTSRPLGLPVDAVAHLTGLVAATATSVELYGRGARHSDGQHFALLDVTALETIASLTFGNVAQVAFGVGEANRTAEARPAGWAVALLRCRDGYVCLVTLEERQWQDWLAVLGDPEWGTSPLFSDRNQRSKNWDALAHFIEAITSEIPKAELASRAQARRVPCTPVASVSELLDSEQLSSRGFFRTLSPSTPTPTPTPIKVPDLSSLWTLQRSETR